MRVSGEDAKNWQAVRTDSLETVNRGVLTMASEDTGDVQWIDRTGQPAQAALGPNAIRLLPAYRYGR
jgi:hypothetical protein